MHARTRPPAPPPSRPPVVVDEITLDGRKIQVRNADIPLEKVRLDHRNPRIANTVQIALGSADGAIQEKLEALLWQDDDVRDLYRQVLINEGLVERIIVREDGSVVEGNCRTVVYRRLRAAFPDDERWRKIPSRVLPPDIAERDVAILLGEMHVAGKNTWSSFEKAGHVYRLHKDFALTQDEIAQRLRMSKSKVNQLIRAFEVMKHRFLPAYPGTASVRKFSYFEEFYKNPALRDWASINAGAEDLFVRWVGTNKLSLGSHVRELPAMVENEEAVRALTEEGILAARAAIGEDNPAIASKLLRRMLEMTQALRKAQLDEVHRVRNPDNTHARQIVQDLSEALGHFRELCGLD